VQLAHPAAPGLEARITACRKVFGFVARVPSGLERARGKHSGAGQVTSRDAIGGRARRDHGAASRWQAGFALAGTVAENIARYGVRVKGPK